MMRKLSFDMSEKTYDRFYHVGIFGIVAVTSVIMLLLANGTPLWLDEMFQVDYCRTASLFDLVTIDPLTPPLFDVIAWLWYHIVPFGEIWLRIPSIAFTVLSALFIAATGRLIGGRRTGFTAAFLFAINAKVFSQAALSFRTYGLLLLLSSCLVYLYVRRVRKPSKEVRWRDALLAAMTMTLLGYTHYFGVLLCIAFFLLDIFLLIRGRLGAARNKIALSYAIPLVLYLPWIGVALCAFAKISTSTTAIHWQATPDTMTVHSLLYWLCGECAETLGLFHIGAILLIVLAIWHIHKRVFDWREEFAPLALLLTVFCIVGVMYVYSEYVNPQSMFWVERYFSVLIPSIMLVTAWGMTQIFDHTPVPEPLRFLMAFLCVALLIPTCMGTVTNDLSEQSSTRFYRPLSTYLMQQKDISDDDTLVMLLIDTTDRGRQIDAWKHYYFDMKDTRDFKVNIVDGLDSSVQINAYDLLRYKTIYITSQHFDPSIPDSYTDLLRTYYKKHKTDNPGGGQTYYYTRNY